MKILGRNCVFDINGKFFGFLEETADLVLLNVLFLICCIPVITIGASKTALYDMTRRMAAKREGYLVRGFFRSFSQNFKASTMIWLGYAVCMTVAAADIYAGFLWRKGALSGILVFVFAAGGIGASMTFFYALALQGSFENSIKNTVKNGFLLSAGHLPATMVILTVEAAPVIFAVFFTHRLSYIILFFAGIGFALQGFVNGVIFNRLFDKISFHQPAGYSS